VEEILGKQVVMAVQAEEVALIMLQFVVAVVQLKQIMVEQLDMEMLAEME
jgi:hypothetical protein